MTDTSRDTTENQQYTALPQEMPQYNPLRIEQQVIDYWKANHTFERSIETRTAEYTGQPEQPYRFYDGPPFITGLPHPGSLLSSVVKDVMTRFWTQKGKRIDRVWGWDCHGIYIEQKVQEKLGYTSNLDIESKGIGGFIDACQVFTKDISDQRDWYVDHIGRRVDFKNAYKTMDNDYMESVLWVFKSLRDKGLVYKGKRVSLYSTKLNTPISNYEVAMDNSYADVSDPAVTVKFPVVQEQSSEFETAEDGAIHVVKAIVKNSSGDVQVLLLQRDQNYEQPGGKIDAGETAETALARELREELGVTAISMKPLWSTKNLARGKFFLTHYYECMIEGIPTIQEPEKHQALLWASYEPSDNALGYALRIEGNVLDNADELQQLFPALVHYHQWQLHPEQFADLQDVSQYPMSLLAWTTTPWTLPANLALVIHPDLYYVQVFDIKRKEYFVLAEGLVSKIYTHANEYMVMRRSRGSALIGLRYTPPYPCYTSTNPANHLVYAADYVTATDGTGIVHTAPEFGEEDFQTGLKYGLTQTQALDIEGKYTEEVPQYTGVYYRDANDLIMADLKERALLLKKESITHSVAMCPRTGVPLIYKTQDSWFINIQSIKHLLAANNEKINWLPEHLKHGRFAKSMEGAPDRCISRTRYWATPMPVWMSEDGDMMVLGSREEIYEWSQTGSKNIEKKDLDGKTVYRDLLRDREFDLHRPFIDDVWFMKDGKKYTRIPEVLDPWLESGSMPYAQMHYPFENQEEFLASFPADYVAEYVGQVRAWFFFMHAIATMFTMPYKLVDGAQGKGTLVDDTPVLPVKPELVNSPAFTNVVCTGVLGGDDGRKMSKSYGNYPDPKYAMEQYGGDAMRMYLCTTPIVLGGDAPFAEDGLKETYKKMTLPLWNSYYFYTTYANIDQFIPTTMSLRDIDLASLSNPLDRWMVMQTMELVNTVDAALQTYNMNSSSNAIVAFMDDLTNWYIRRSRRRFWESGVGDAMGADKREAYTVLHCVLAEVCLVLAPFMPMLSEYIYRTLTGKESVHLEYIETYDAALIDHALLADMHRTQTIVSLGLSLRGQKKIRVKQPLPAVMLSDDIAPLYQEMIREELNVKACTIDATLASKVRAVCKPNARLLGKKFGKDMQTVINEAKAGAFVIQPDGSVLVAGTYTLAGEEFVIEYEKGDVPFDVAIDGGLIVALDDTLTDELRLEGDARDLIRTIQEARKTADYRMDDRITLSVTAAHDGAVAEQAFASDVATLLAQYGEMIASETLATLVDAIGDADVTEEVELEMVGKVVCRVKRG